MHPSLARRRSYKGPAFFSYGYKPFFLFAGVLAAFYIPLWLIIYGSGGLWPATIDGLSWHAHEMLFGYLGAVMTGFLLTAVPNWTGRLPINGLGLLGLVLIWLAGRASFWLFDTSSIWPPLVDSLFLVSVALVIWREVILGKNWKNFPVAAIVTVFAVANILFHFEGNTGLPPGFGQRLALAGAAVMISFMGGRLVPSFTRNWLKSQKIKTLPAEFSWFDRVAIATTILAGVLWVGWPDGVITAWALLVAGIMVLGRLFRWQGMRTGRESLVWILHLGYGWVGVAFLLIGGALLWPQSIPAASGLHALTTGGIGVMTIAVMTRATLGHSGRPRVADKITTLLYVLINLAALIRVLAPLAPEAYYTTLVAAGIFWTLAFSLFVYRYSPMMMK